MFRKFLMISAAAVVTTTAVAAEADDSASKNNSIIEAISSGKPIIDVRYRFEFKDQDGFAEDAYANTIRTRLGYESGKLHGFQVLVEFENVATIGDDHFNSTTNGRTQFPVVADPDATELNRAQVKFTGIDRTAVTVGRQRLNLANQRFVGAVDWRQNQQTFDAARLTVGLIDHVTLDYAYVSRVHRIFGDDHPLGEFDSNSHIIAADLDGGEWGKVTAYGLLLDFEEAPAASSSTWGARYQNKFVLKKDADLSLGVIAEFATQSDYAANPFDYRESYIHGEAALSARGVSGKAGYERLGGDGAIGFSTPLATLHKFQGFADVFLTTPTAGIEDIYGTLSYNWKSAPLGTTIKFFATYHTFQSEMGSMDFGDEIDAGLAVKFKKHWTAEFKGAVYDGGAFGPADRSLIWASLRFQY